MWETPLQNDLKDRFAGKFPVERAASLFYFQSKTRTADIVYDFKYHHDDSAARDMGRMMGREMLTSGFFDGIDGIVPVPLHPNRLRTRGYNQSEEIAKGISEVVGIPVMSRLLERTVDTVTQTHLSRLERTDNTYKAFALKKNARVQCPVHLLIVDDVITTGSTMHGCYEALKELPGLTLSILSVGCVRL